MLGEMSESLVTDPQKLITTTSSEIIQHHILMAVPSSLLKYSMCRLKSRPWHNPVHYPSLDVFCSTDVACVLGS